MIPAWNREYLRTNLWMVPTLEVLAAGALFVVTSFLDRAACDGAHGVNFVALVTGSAMLLALLNFLPALSLGPLAEGLH